MNNIGNKVHIGPIPPQEPIKPNQEATQRGRLSGSEIQHLVEDFKVGFLDNILSKISSSYADKIENLKETHATTKLKEAFQDLKSRVKNLSAEDKTELANLKKLCVTLEKKTNDTYIGLQLRALSVGLEFIESEVVAGQAQTTTPAAATASKPTSPATAAATTTATQQKNYTSDSAFKKALEQLKTLSPITVDNLEEVKAAYEVAEKYLDEYLSRHNLAYIHPRMKGVNPDIEIGAASVSFIKKAKELREFVTFQSIAKLQTLNSESMDANNLNKMKAAYDNAFKNNSTRNLEPILGKWKERLQEIEVQLSKASATASASTAETKAAPTASTTATKQKDAMEAAKAFQEAIQQLKKPITTRNFDDMKKAYTVASAYLKTPDGTMMSTRSEYATFEKAGEQLKVLEKPSATNNAATSSSSPSYNKTVAFRSTLTTIQEEDEEIKAASADEAQIERERLEHTQRADKDLSLQEQRRVLETKTYELIDKAYNAAQHDSVDSRTGQPEFESYLKYSLNHTFQTSGINKKLENIANDARKSFPGKTPDQIKNAIESAVEGIHTGMAQETEDYNYQADWQKRGGAFAQLHEWLEELRTLAATYAEDAREKNSI